MPKTPEMTVPVSLTRRDLLRGFAASALAGACSRMAGAVPAAEFPFEQIPAAASGISWTHVNGKSFEKYLPETTGAGCAFLDYNNDGWMDILLVNSGSSAFFHPEAPLHPALYRRCV